MAGLVDFLKFLCKVTTMGALFVASCFGLFFFNSFFSTPARSSSEFHFDVTTAAISRSIDILQDYRQLDPASFFVMSPQFLNNRCFSEASWCSSFGKLPVLQLQAKTLASSPDSSSEEGKTPPTNQVLLCSSWVCLLAR